jgi:signal transduction histidine kinase/CheY-like chemotaxis protein
MSKKLLPNRLEILFSDIEAVAPLSVLPQNTVSPGWIWEATANGTYISCSEEVKECLGYEPSQIVGRSIFELPLSPESVPALKNSLHLGLFPVEINVTFLSYHGGLVSVRLSIYSRSSNNGDEGSFRGFAQITTPAQSQDKESPQDIEKPADYPPISRAHLKQRLSSVAIDADNQNKPKTPWTSIGKHTLSTKQAQIQPSIGDQPATIALPIDFHDQGVGLLEIIDTQKNRAWNEEEQLLAKEVANQLSLAIENASLFVAAQLELSERIRAEQEILRRNQDLAILNEIGQNLSRLTEKEEIFTTLQESLGQLFDIRNLTIAVVEKNLENLSFPVHILDGKSINLDPCPLSTDIVSETIKRGTIIRYDDNVATELANQNKTLPGRLPHALIAVPMVIGDRAVGAILLQDFYKKNAYSDSQSDLLSTIASQVAITLEKANLFQEVTTALQVIENRERYQANVALAVATLTEFGIKAIPDVLRYLGQASGCDHVYFAKVVENDQGYYWHVSDQWTNNITGPLTKIGDQKMISAASLVNWSRTLREKGLVEVSLDEVVGSERQFLEKRGIQSILLLSVFGNHDIPGFIGFEQCSNRTWKRDEIGVLQVAADALANTYVRQDLLEQLRSSLDETETLYKISHNLALANNYHEMVTALTTGLHTDAINRIVFVRFEQDNTGNIIQMQNAASWYSGSGAKPPAVGTSLDMNVFHPLLKIDKPIYYNDIYDIGITTEIRSRLQQLQIQSLAILPLTAGRRQLGALLLLSENPHKFSIREMRTFPPLVDQMATAVENLRLFEQTQSALAETELFYQVSNGIAQATNANDLLELVRKYVLPTNVDRAAIFLFYSSNHSEHIDFEIIADWSEAENFPWKSGRQPGNVLPFINTFKDQILIISDLDNSPLDIISKETLAGNGIRAGLFAPLYSAGKLIGMLLTTASQPVQFTSDEIHILQVVCNGITVAIERQRLLREAQRRALELEAAAEIARDTTSLLSLDELLKRIVNLLNNRFEFYQTAIFLVNAEGTHALIRETCGAPVPPDSNYQIKIPVGSRSIIGLVTSLGEPVIVNDVSTSDFYLPNPYLTETKSEMGIPLRISDRIIGALDIQSNQLNAFSQDEIAVLQILADQIAVAIENARAYELAQKAYEEMREVDRMKSQFLANMSHELRTPLNSIIGFSRVILKGIDGPINDIQKQDLTSIYNSGQHLLGLINDVLDLSKIEAGKMELQFEEVHLSDLINSVMSTAVGLVNDKPIKLRHTFAPDLPMVNVDVTRIRQVLLNYLSNAAKFTDEGSITVEAQQILSPQGEPEVMVTVTDTGEGIAEKDVEKLFQPFSQVDDSPTRKTGGTGLGLSICRSFIEMHAGRIGLLWSEVGKGSTFFFTLPCLTNRNHQDFVDELTPTSSDKIILSIDDDLQVINLYKRFLQPNGYIVVPITQPKQAVFRAKEIQPLAITLDIMMPDQDGWQIINALKSDPETRNIPIIICSILEDEAKGFSLGASEYLVKPFLQEDLVNAIFRLNRERQLNRILIVDDSVEDQRLIKSSISERDHIKFEFAHNGSEALMVIDSFRPDIIILDLFMPGMNGFEFLGELRTNEAFSEIPVLILTGADLTTQQRQQLAEFGQNMLNKSTLRENELMTKLEDVISRMSPKIC